MAPSIPQSLDAYKLELLAFAVDEFERNNRELHAEHQDDHDTYEHQLFNRFYQFKRDVKAILTLTELDR